MNKIFVTGAGGFIGSHLCELLVEKGFHVKAFVRYNSMNKMGWLESSKFYKDFEIISGDVRDFDSISKAMKDCSYVFHLAALIGIPYSYISPLAYLKTNVEGTYNILEASKNFEMKCIVITSTSETYGTAQYIPIDEKHPMVGQSPYAASKIAADQLAISYNLSFNLPIKIIRPFNTYGPRQSARAIIPTIISQLLSGTTKLELGNLSPTRDLTYVKDTVKGFYEITFSNELFGEITNIGMQKDISVNDLADYIIKYMNVKVEIISEDIRKRPEKSEVQRLICDNSKIKKFINWKPEYSFEDGIAKTIQWMEENLEFYKPKIYNV